MNNIKIYAGIVSYNPIISDIKQEIESLKELNIPIVIIDNNSDNKELLKILFNEYANISSVVWNDVNQGIARAHNQILEICNANGASHVITFDQDSAIPHNIITEYSKYISRDIGVICPSVNYINYNDKKRNTTSFVVEKEWCIASASMINIQAWKEVGGFDERLFIDLVDTDFCLRVKNAGYRNIELTNVALNHNLGTPVSKKIFFHKFITTNHSPQRKYYKVRNNIILAKKGLLSPIKVVYHIYVIIIETLFLEQDKKEKINFIFRGVIDGLKMRITR